MRETRAKKAKSWIRTVQGIVCLFLILSGMFLCLESLLEVRLHWQLRFLAAAFVAIVLQFMQLGWRWMLAEVLVFAGGLWAVGVKYQDVLLVGMKELANCMLELVNAYRRTEYLLWYLDTQESYGWAALLYLLVILGVLEGLLLAATRNKRRHLLVSAIFPVLLITAGLMVGRAVSYVGILLAFAGLLLEVLDTRERGNFLLGSMVAVSMAVSLFLIGNGQFWGQVELWHQEWYPRQLAFEDRMLALAEQISHMPLFSVREQRQYALRNTKPELTGKEVFKITVDYPISSPLYIRGFAGGTYENGTWQRVSRQEFSDWAQSMGGDEKTYAEIVQSFPYEILQNYGMIGRKKHVSLEFTQKLGRYSLMPYFTKAPKGQEFLADGIYPPSEERKFEWDTYMNLSDYDVSIALGIYMDASSVFEDFSSRKNIFSAYGNYAEKMYTRLPEEGVEKLRAYLEEYRKTHPSYEEQMQAATDKLDASGKDAWYFEEMQKILTEEEWQLFTMTERDYQIKEIQQLLWEDNYYSFDLEEVPEGEDSVEYFLFEQHKGYCIHFASAATLLLRMYGIPARFASGYLVLPSDFKENGDRTWTASVTDERAHAWTEIFGDNIGFTPLEATPPSYVEMLENVEEDESLVHAVEEEERALQEKGGKQESQEEQKKQEEQEQKEKEEQAKKDGQGNASGGGSGTAGIQESKAVRQMSAAVFMVVSVVFLICLLLWWRRKLLLRRWQQKVTQKDRSRAVCEIGIQMGRILRQMGKKRPWGMDDREYGDYLKRELPETDWEEIFFIFQKARFSEYGVTEGEYKEILSVYQKLAEDLLNGGSVRGLYLRYIKIYP